MTELSNSKELYAFTYKEHLNTMLVYGWLAAKIGDAIDTEKRWKNSDISGANEASSKLKINVWQNLVNIKRDHDIRPDLTAKFPPHPDLDGSGTEYHTFYPPEELIEDYRDTLDTGNLFTWVKEEIDIVLNARGKNNSLASYKPRFYQQNAKDLLVDFAKTQDSVKCLDIHCPRSGKTLLNLDRFIAFADINLMLLPVYWLSAITSYKSESKRFKEFVDIVTVDSVVDENWDIIARNALAQGKKVFVGVSLHHSDEWFEKHQWIHEYDKRTFCVAEEGDFGSHTENSLEKYNWLLANKNVVESITSGTNAGRLAKIGGSKIDLVITTLYSELENSDDDTIVKRNFVKMTVPSAVVEYADAADRKLGVNWTKLLGKPLQNQDFHKKFWRGLLSYEPEWGNSIEQIAGKEIEVFRARVNSTKAQMDQLADILNKACPNHYFAVINGDVTDNREAEKYAKNLIHRLRLGFFEEKNKVVFLVKQMGSRSWSVGDLEVSINLTDGGELGAFDQEVSRPLSPKLGKTDAWLIDCAFDSNRTSMVELSIINEAVALTEKTKTSITENLRFMYNNISLTNCDEFGVNLIPVDKLLTDWEDNTKILEIADNATDYKAILQDPLALEILSKCKTIPKNDRQKVETLLLKAKTYGTKGQTANSTEVDREAVRFKQLILGAIRSINSSATTVYDFADGGTSFSECLKLIQEDKPLDNNFEEMYNISTSDVIYLLDEGYLPKSLLDMCVNNSSRA